MVISRADIVERVGEWQLTEEVIEKDYVLGWLLSGIGSDPSPRRQVGLQRRHLLEEVLHRDPPLL